MVVENPGAAPQDRHIWRKQAHPPQSLCWPSAAPAPANAPLYSTPQPWTPTRQPGWTSLPPVCVRVPTTGSFPASLHWTNRPSTRVQLLCPLGVWVLPQAATRPVSLLKTESRGRMGDNTKQVTHTESQPVTVTYYTIHKHQTSAGTDPQ